MDPNVAEQILDELIPSLEALEAQTTAVLQFLKSKSKAGEKQLAPYLEQAEKASSVRWRVTRLRVMSLLSSAVKNEEESAVARAGPAEKKTRSAEGQSENKEDEQEKTETSQAAALKQAGTSHAEEKQSASEDHQAGASETKPEEKGAA